ncbi:MAG: VanW family protein, partial [Armatimonadota bacterium]|nr:VanW family protein [Armatimonadota bacterium]
ADVNRTQNVRLAARALNGTVIPAGAVFSYNQAVGPRLEALGYRVAKIFLRGRILDGVGGGVCQVASTVYNAALESGLPIVERARHSRPVPYVPEGRDATVSYGGVDLKFRNPFNAPLLIQTRVAGSSLTVSIYGNHRFRRGVATPARAAQGRALRLISEVPKSSTSY